jgi:hypothetical protein
MAERGGNHSGPEPGHANVNTSRIVSCCTALYAMTLDCAWGVEPNNAWTSYWVPQHWTVQLSKLSHTIIDWNANCLLNLCFSLPLLLLLPHTFIIANLTKISRREFEVAAKFVSLLTLVSHEPRQLSPWTLPLVYLTLSHYVNFSHCFELFLLHLNFEEYRILTLQTSSPWFGWFRVIQDGA